MPFNYKLLGYDDNFNDMLQSAEIAIDKMNLWYWVRDFDEPEGFADTSNPIMYDLGMSMSYQGHSGSSIARTMRSMQTIAKHGMRVFIEEVPHFASYENFFRTQFGETGHELHAAPLMLMESNAWWNAEEKRFLTLDEHIAYVSAR
jgi:hypothetical protein